ncbi:hypothetical protein B0H10DRAFT_1938004 [Mycena sp. CBHHK59/15]|nr:hypothetical protein B0H10DRAFT_1938004 [Mycena sp. CBHHK59/15]
MTLIHPVNSPLGSIIPMGTWFPDITIETQMGFLQAKKRLIEKMAIDLLSGAVPVAASLEKYVQDLMTQAQCIVKNGWQPAFFMINKFRLSKAAIQHVFPGVPICICQFHIMQENVFHLADLAPGLPAPPARQNRTWQHKKIADARIDSGASTVPEYYNMYIAKLNAPCRGGTRSPSPAQLTPPVLPNLQCLHVVEVDALTSRLASPTLNDCLQGVSPVRQFCAGSMTMVHLESSNHVQSFPWHASTSSSMLYGKFSDAGILTGGLPTLNVSTNTLMPSQRVQPGLVRACGLTLRPIGSAMSGVSTGPTWVYQRAEIVMQCSQLTTGWSEPSRLSIRSSWVIAPTSCLGPLSPNTEPEPRVRFRRSLNLEPEPAFRNSATSGCPIFDAEKTSLRANAMATASWHLIGVGPTLAMVCRLCPGDLVDLLIEPRAAAASGVHYKLPRQGGVKYCTAWIAPHNRHASSTLESTRLGNACGHGLDCCPRAEVHAVVWALQYKHETGSVFSVHPWHPPLLSLQQWLNLRWILCRDLDSSRAMNKCSGFKCNNSWPNAEPDLWFKFSSFPNLEPEPRVQFSSVQFRAYRLVLILANEWFQYYQAWSYDKNINQDALDLAATAYHLWSSTNTVTEFEDAEGRQVWRVARVDLIPLIKGPDPWYDNSVSFGSTTLPSCSLHSIISLNALGRWEACRKSFRILTNDCTRQSQNEQVLPEPPTSSRLGSGPHPTLAPCWRWKMSPLEPLRLQLQRVPHTLDASRPMNAAAHMPTRVQVLALGHPLAQPDLPLRIPAHVARACLQLLRVQCMADRLRQTNTVAHRSCPSPRTPSAMSGHARSHFHRGQRSSSELADDPQSVLMLESPPHTRQHALQLIWPRADERKSESPERGGRHRFSSMRGRAAQRKRA